MSGTTTGIFLTCLRGCLEHRPLLTDPPVGEKCERTIREEKSRRVCGKPWIASKPIGGKWDRIPGPWWDGL